MDRGELLYGLKNALEIYHVLSRSVCREWDLHQHALDILDFMGWHPDGCLAKDIVKYRYLTPSMVSINVDDLVKKGYLVRRPIPGDRRKVLLRATEKAAPIIAQTIAIRDEFYRTAYEGILAEDLEVFSRVSIQVGQNLAQGLEKLLEK